MRLLRERGFRLLWTAQLLNVMATWSLRAVLLIWIYALTHSGVAVSLVGLAEALPLLLLSPVSGVYADRWHRAHLMAGASAATGLLILLLLSVNSRAGLPVIAGTAVLSNACGQLFYTASNAAVPVVVGTERAGEANGALSMLAGGVAVVGPGAAAIAYSSIGAHGTIVALSALFLLASPVAAAIPAPRADRSGEGRTGMRREMLDGLRYVYRSRLLSTLAALAFIAFLGIGALTVLDVLFVSRALHLPSADVGVLYSSSGAGELVGGILMAVFGRFTRSYHRLLGFGIVANAVAFVGYALSPALWLAAAILFFVGLTFPPIIVSYMTMVQYVSEDAFRGRVSSVINATIGVATILSAASGGALADLFGVRQIIGSAAVLWGTSGLLTFATVRSTPLPRDEAQAPGEEEGTLSAAT